MSVSVHILDNSRGRPAAGVAVCLTRCADAVPQPVGEGFTDFDGRLAGLAPGPLTPGTHRLVFDTGAYFERLGIAALHPRVVVEFDAAEGSERYHIPLLITPFSYTTYRGS